MRVRFRYRVFAPSLIRLPLTLCVFCLRFSSLSPSCLFLPLSLILLSISLRNVSFSLFLFFLFFPSVFRPLCLFQRRHQASPTKKTPSPTKKTPNKKTSKKTNKKTKINKKIQQTKFKIDKRHSSFLRDGKKSYGRLKKTL